jgi:hypothetical protein
VNERQYYETFVGIQRHFNTSYDYVKYHGKVKISEKYFKVNEYACKKLKMQFNKPEEFKWLCIANLLLKPKLWITELLDAKSHEIYYKRMSCVHSIEYNFKNDLDILLRYGTLNGVLQYESEPIAYKLTKCNDIKLESIIILDKIFDLFNLWLKDNSNIIMNNYINTWKKYSKFIDINDLSRYNQITLQLCKT